MSEKTFLYSLIMYVWLVSEKKQGRVVWLWDWDYVFIITFTAFLSVIQSTFWYEIWKYSVYWEMFRISVANALYDWIDCKPVVNAREKFLKNFFDFDYHSNWCDNWSPFWHSIQFLIFVIDFWKSEKYLIIIWNKFLFFNILCYSFH